MRFEAGFELTFTNDELIRAGAARGELVFDTPQNLAACSAFARAIRDAIGPDHGHAIEDDGHGFARHVITYPDGYWLRIEIDPWVVEATGRHRSVAEYRALAPRFAHHVFAPAAALGLVPHERIGGGHVHLSRTSFGPHPLLLRNFLVDFWNHPELALGLLAYDPLNAPAISCAPAAQRETLARAIEQFDGGRLDLDGLLATLRRDVYITGALELPAHADRSKYQAICVNHPRTIEIRAIRPQASFDDLLLVLELLERRLAFLRDVTTPLPLVLEPHPQAPMAPDEAVPRFRAYLHEMALPWARFQALLRPPYAPAPPPSLTMRA